MPLSRVDGSPESYTSLPEYLAAVDPVGQAKADLNRLIMDLASSLAGGSQLTCM